MSTMQGGRFCLILWVPICDKKNFMHSLNYRYKIYLFNLEIKLLNQSFNCLTVLSVN